MNTEKTVDKDNNVPRKIEYELGGVICVNTRCVLCNREYSVPKEFAEDYICWDCADLYTR